MYTKDTGFDGMHYSVYVMMVLFYVDVDFVQFHISTTVQKVQCINKSENSFTICQ